MRTSSSRLNLKRLICRWVYRVKNNCKYHWWQLEPIISLIGWRCGWKSLKNRAKGSVLLGNSSGPSKLFTIDCWIFAIKWSLVSESVSVNVNSWILGSLESLGILILLFENGISHCQTVQFLFRCLGSWDSQPFDLGTNKYSWILMRKDWQKILFYLWSLRSITVGVWA